MENAFYIRTIQSLIKLMNDKGLSQARMAELAGTSPSQFSKMLKFQVKLSFDHISNLATNLQMSELDIFTYPDRYVKAGSSDQEPVEAILQIKLKKDKKDQVLRLVFGDNNIEILNK
jgi:transcriptional regulator with XRE-family HTH domain